MVSTAPSPNRHSGIQVQVHTPHHTTPHTLAHPKFHMAIPEIQNGCNSGFAEAAGRIQIAEQAVHVESHERTN